MRWPSSNSDCGRHDQFPFLDKIPVDIGQTNIKDSATTSRRRSDPEVERNLRSQLNRAERVALHHRGAGCFPALLGRSRSEQAEYPDKSD